MSVLLTAFGPFGGRVENASSLALVGLRGLRGLAPGLRTRVLPVDAVVAPARLKDALRRIRPRVLVMLGEAGGSSGIRLERTAWNEFDFRIPDVAGRQRSGAPVVRGAPVSLASTLPLDRLHERLAADGHPVEFSDDPGRYLCNQLFFTAREWLDRHLPDCRAGFIHLPLEDALPVRDAVRALSVVLDELGAFSRSPRSGPAATRSPRA